MAQKQTTLINTRLSPRFLRLGWLLVFLLVACLDIAGIPYRYGEVFAEPYTIMSQRGASQAPVIQALDEAGISRSGYSAYLTGLEAFQFLPFLIFGILIFRFRPGDRGAKLISLLLLLGMSERFLSTSLTHLFGIWAGQSITLVTSSALTLVFFLFPDGRFVPRWTKWVMIPFVLIAVPATFFPGSQWDPNQYPVFMIMGLAIFGAMIYSQVYRYRRISRPLERLQTRWVVAGLAAFPVFLVTNSLILPALAPSLTVINAETIRFHILINLLILQPLLLVLPIGMGISLLRYRLYDLDIIIRKTLVYAVLTGVLAIFYFSVVLLSQNAFARFGAGQSPAALVLSTLAIAALFNPLRRRIQGFIDRRFYRAKYNAELALEEFTRVARAETDPEHLAQALNKVVTETIQPEQILLWLNKKRKSSGANPTEYFGSSGIRNAFRNV
jgi:hypothetical protein